MIDFFLDHPIILGVCMGGGAIGGPLGIIGWCVGYDHAMRQVVGMMIPEKVQAHGDMPLVPAGCCINANGALVVPDDSRMRGHLAALSNFDHVVTVGGRVLKSRDGEL